MNTMSRGMLATAVAVLLTLLPGCSHKAPSGSGDKITLHLDESSLLYLPIYFAADNQYFTDEGLQVELVYYESAASIRDSLGHSSRSIVAAHPVDVLEASQSAGSISIIGQVVGCPPLHVLGPSSQSQSTTRLRVPVDAPDVSLYESWALGHSSAAANEPAQISPYESLASIDWPTLADEVLVVGEPASARGVAAGAQIRRSAANDLSPHCYRVLAMDTDTMDSADPSVRAFLRALQRAMTALQADPQLAIDTASNRFPDVDAALLQPIVIRLLSEGICPGSVLLSTDSWANTLAVTGHESENATNIRLDSAMLRANE